VGSLEVRTGLTGLGLVRWVGGVRACGGGSPIVFGENGRELSQYFNIFNGYYAAMTFSGFVVTYRGGPVTCAWHAGTPNGLRRGW